MLSGSYVRSVGSFVHSSETPASFRSVGWFVGSVECFHSLQPSSVRHGWFVRSSRTRLASSVLRPRLRQRPPHLRSQSRPLVTLYPTEPPVTGLSPVSALSLAHSPTSLPQLAYASLSLTHSPTELPPSPLSNYQACPHCSSLLRSLETKVSAFGGYSLPRCSGPKLIVATYLLEEMTHHSTPCLPWGNSLSDSPQKIGAL